MLRRTVIIVVALAAALGLAGCGDDDPTNVASADGTTTTTEAEADDEPASGLAGSISSAKCIAAASGMAQAAMGFQQSTTGAGGDDFDAYLEELDEFAEAAPKAIRADLQTVVAAYSQFAEVVKDSGYEPGSGKAPTKETIEAIEKASKAMGTSEVQEASDRLDAWFTEECGK